MNDVAFIGVLDVLASNLNLRVGFISGKWV